MRRDGELRATYTYDDNGNRTQVVRAGELPITAAYDEQDRLTAYGAATYTYTDAGALASKTDASGTTTYVYDALGALTRVKLPDGVVLDYAIDAYGRRVAVKRNGVVERGFLYQGGLSPVAELDADGAVREPLRLRPALERARDDGPRRQDLPDRHRPRRQPARGRRHGQRHGRAADRLRRVRARDARHRRPGFQPFGFAGGLLDRDTGLVRFGARDYDPETGRLTRKDPLGFVGGGTNLYGYALADPVNLTDPTGPDPGHDPGRRVPDLRRVPDRQGAAERVRAVRGERGGLRCRPGRDLHPGCHGRRPAVRGIAAAGKGLDALSDAGRAAAKGGRTRAGREYQKHMDRGELPSVPGKNLDSAGQDLLDDILTHPGTREVPVPGGRAAGGRRFISPDGSGVTFFPDGSFAYFGKYLSRP